MIHRIAVGLLVAAALIASAIGAPRADAQAPSSHDSGTGGMAGMQMSPGMPMAPGMPTAPGAGMPAVRRAPRVADRRPADSSATAGMAMGAGADGPMAMRMPIPMPAGMPMIPGLMGLAPPGGVFVPGRGVDVAALPAAARGTVVRLRDGDTLDLTAGLVRRTFHGHPYAMYAFNGQVPGPLIRVQQNATIIVRFHNRIDLPTSMHWHGVRLDNRYDGSPGVTQDAIPVEGRFMYRVHFPDAGLYWYHPHVREDIEQSMGLFGNMLVDSPAHDYYPPANSEQVLMLGDLLMQDDSLIPFGAAGPDYVLMGRIGNVLLVNGEPSYAYRAPAGAVVRFYLTNVSSARTYNVSFGGAPIKVIASDVSRFEHEALVSSVVLAPAERYVVDVRFPRAGRFAIVNAVQAINHMRGEFTPEVDTLGVVAVGTARAIPDYGASFAVLRTNADVARDIDRFRPQFDRPPDMTLRLTVATTGLPLATVQFMTIDTAYFAPVEWVDGMPDMNWLSTSSQVRWILRDDATGKENMDIDWHVPAGSIVKLRLFNDPHSFHPMQHPIHLHGQRMLVVSRDGVPNADLVWKDTVIVPVGSTVDLLIDASNPGAWMLHCHIGEHLGAGMMTVMHVDPG